MDFNKPVSNLSYVKTGSNFNNYVKDKAVSCVYIVMRSRLSLNVEGAGKGQYTLYCITV